MQRQNIKKLFFTCNFLLFLIFGINLVTVQGTKYEAENGTLTGAVTVQSSRPGYSGSGYVGLFENNGDKVAISFSLSVAGNYDLYIGYAAPSGQKINNISINGNSAEVTYPASDAFTEVSFGKVSLRAGSNIIEIIKNWGWFYVDYIRIESNSDPEVVVTIPYQLATPDPMTGTQRLFYYLMNNFGKNILSGTMSLNATEEAEWLYANTGKYPALIGLDFMNHTRDYGWYDKTVLINKSIEWYRQNGVVSLCWHWRDPLRTTDAFYTSDTGFDISKISDESSAEYQAMVSDIDIVAGYLQQLQDSAVPVLFRPLHEASGGWFWWGAHGAAPCKALWRLMFDRLVQYHGLKNMIWVWTTDTQEDNMDWYPGDEYVDILSADIYAATNDFSSQLLTFNKIKEDFQGKKLVTLSENGIVPDPDNLVADKAGWSWFMTWYGDYVRNGVWNPLSHWQEVMNHQYVITLDEMPDLATYPLTGLRENSNTHVFSVFISPADMCLRVRHGNYEGAYSLNLFDITGKIFLERTGIREEYSENVSYLRKGVYMVQIITLAGQKTYKVVR